MKIGYTLALAGALLAGGDAAEGQVLKKEWPKNPYSTAVPVHRPAVNAAEVDLYGGQLTEGPSALLATPSDRTSRQTLRQIWQIVWATSTEQDEDETDAIVTRSLAVSTPHYDFLIEVGTPTYAFVPFMAVTIRHKLKQQVTTIIDGAPLPKSLVTFRRRGEELRMNGVADYAMMTPAAAVVRTHAGTQTVDADYRTLSQDKKVKRLFQKFNPLSGAPVPEREAIEFYFDDEPVLREIQEEYQMATSQILAVLQALYPDYTVSPYHPTVKTASPTQ